MSFLMLTNPFYFTRICLFVSETEEKCLFLTRKCLYAASKNAFFCEKVPFCLENRRKKYRFWTRKCPFCRLQKCLFLDKSAFLEFESALLFQKQVKNASIGRLQMTFILKSIFSFSSSFLPSFLFFSLFRVLTKGHIQPPQPKGRGGSCPPCSGAPG